MHSTNCIGSQANGKATRGGAETEEEYGRWKKRREAGREEKREDSELISLLAVASLNCLRPPASFSLSTSFSAYYLSPPFFPRRTGSRAIYPGLVSSCNTNHDESILEIVKFCQFGPSSSDIQAISYLYARVSKFRTLYIRSPMTYVSIPFPFGWYAIRSIESHHRSSLVNREIHDYRRKPIWGDIFLESRGFNTRNYKASTVASTSVLSLYDGLRKWKCRCCILGSWNS